MWKQGSTPDSWDDQNTTSALLVIIGKVDLVRVMQAKNFILIIIFLSGLAGADDFSELAAGIDRIRAEHNVSAAAAIVVNADKILLEHYSGVTNWESQKPVDSQTYFRIGSISKAFTGLALLRAEELGHISLDQKVATFLPEPQYSNRWEETHPLRIAQLLEHTAGWYDMSGVEFNDKNPKPLSLAEALAMRPQSRVMHWPPGWHSEYSNSGPGLAAYIVEVATGQVFDQFIVDQVFKPLGMSSASLLWSPEIEKQRATGYNTDGRSEIPYWHIVFRPSGGMNVLPRDMARFMQMLLNSGSLGGRAVFDASLIKRMETPKTTLAATTGLEYGYGLGVYGVLHKGHVLLGHGGDADGYLAHFRYSRESGKAYYVVINAFNHAPLRALQNLLNDYLVDGLSDHEKPAVPDIDTAVLESYTGSYRPASVRFPHNGWQDKILRIKLKGDRLLTTENGSRWRRLYPLNAQHFRRSDEPVATAAFIPVTGGRMVLQGRMGNWIRTVGSE